MELGAAMKEGPKLHSAFGTSFSSFTHIDVSLLSAQFADHNEVPRLSLIFHPDPLHCTAVRRATVNCHRRRYEAHVSMLLEAQINFEATFQPPALTMEVRRIAFLKLQSFTLPHSSKQEFDMAPKLNVDSRGMFTFAWKAA